MYAAQINFLTNKTSIFAMKLKFSIVYYRYSNNEVLLVPYQLYKVGIISNTIAIVIIFLQALSIEYVNTA